MNARRVARVLLASGGWLALSLGVALAVALPFSDDFENVPAGYYPNGNGWRTWFSGVTAYVSNQVAHSPTRSFRLQSSPYWSRCDYVFLDKVPDRLTYQVSVLMDPVPGRAAWVGMAHGVGLQYPRYNCFAIRSQIGFIGTVEFAGAPGWPPVLLGQFPTGRWVAISADIDFRACVADLWLDGLLVASDVPVQPKEFDDPLLGHLVLNRFAIGENNWNGLGTGVIYVDDVSLLEPVPPTIEATVEIAPDTLNLRSRGRWITCYIELPEEHSVTDIDVGSLLLNDTVGPDQWPVAIGDYDYDGVPDLMVKFNRSMVANMLAVGEQEVTLTGHLVDGTPLAGSYVIWAVR